MRPWFVKCHDCGQIREVVGRLEGNLVELGGKVEATNKEMKIVAKLEGSLVRMNKKIDEKVGAMTNRQDEIEQEVKREMKVVKENLK